MRLLFLSKRRPQGRDLFHQPFGRFYHLPRLLAERGHEVDLLLLDYGRERPLRRDEGRLCIQSLPAWPATPLSYARCAARRMQERRHDWVIGCSDIWFGLMAERLARLRGTRVLIDAYDNYETYHPMVPPLRRLWRRALHRADAVTAAGPQLASFMTQTAARARTDVVPMAADDCFRPRDRAACRHAVGLPAEGRLLGYMGAADRRRNMGLLLKLWPRLKAWAPDLRLVLSGRRKRHVQLPEDGIWLGYRPPEQVPLILNSLNLVFVLNRRSTYGDYSYPSKLYEAMACRVPAVAANVPGTAWILRDHQTLLASPTSVEDFFEKARAALPMDRCDYGVEPGWTASADRLETILTGG